VPEESIGTRLGTSSGITLSAFVDHFFPSGKKYGSEWKIGDVSGAPGESLGAELEGERAGLWRDRATAQGGKLRQLIARSRSISDEEAVGQLEQAFGVNFRKNGGHSARGNPQQCFEWVKLVEAVTDEALRFNSCVSRSVFSEIRRQS
jgi:hypothetical protein